MAKITTDKEYELLRDSFISIAVKYADESVGKTSANTLRDEWCTAWNLAYLGKMDELVSERLGSGR